MVLLIAHGTCEFIVMAPDEIAKRMRKLAQKDEWNMSEELRVGRA